MLNTQYSLTSEINRQSALEQQISQLQYDISSGVKVHVASDDPAAAARINQIGIQQANQTTWSSNVTMAQAVTTQLDSNLTNVQTLVTQLKEQMLQASNGTLNDSDRASVISQMQSIQSQLTTLSQEKDSNGNALYATGSATQIPIGQGVTVAAGDSYDDVFGSVPLSSGGTSSLNDIISNAISALQGGSDGSLDSTAVADSLNALDDASTHISTTQSDLGVRETRLNNASDALASSATNLATERSGLEDTDATTAYATLSNKMTILNAAQSVLATINKTSLFDKLS